MRTRKDLRWVSIAAYKFGSHSEAQLGTYSAYLGWGFGLRVWDRDTVCNGFHVLQCVAAKLQSSPTCTGFCREKYHRETTQAQGDISLDITPGFQSCTAQIEDKARVYLRALVCKRAQAGVDWFNRRLWARHCMCEMCIWLSCFIDRPASHKGT